MVAMIARSRRPTTFESSIESSSERASSCVRIGVLPFLIEYLGPRTGAAGFVATTWPTSSQSNSIRMAARCCLTDGLAKRRPRSSMYAETWIGSMSIKSRSFAPHQPANSRTPRRYARRVFGFRMFAAKNSRNRRAAPDLLNAASRECKASESMVATNHAPEVFGHHFGFFL
jgi:hypothetical protein